MERLIIEVSIRAAMAACATGAILFLLRARGAAARHAAWTGVMTLMLLLPAWTVWGPKAKLRLLAAPSVIVPEALRSPPRGEADVAFANPVQTDSAVRVAAPRAFLWSWRDFAFAIYAIGALWLLLRLVIGTLGARRLRRDAVASVSGILVSDACAAPVTAGYFRPVIILPTGWREWTPSQLDVVLAHERAHSRRRDPLVHWLALLNRALFWFHPLAWWLERRLVALAEEACDDAVLRQGHDPVEYAECLLGLERLVKKAGARVPALAMAMPGAGLPRRIRMIFDGPRWPRMSRARIACVAIACTTTAAVFGAGTVQQVAPLSLPLPPVRLPRTPVLLAQAASPKETPTKQTPSPTPAAPAPRLEFEVASVRVALPPGPRLRGMRGGPMDPSGDPGQFTASYAMMSGLLVWAYGFETDQIVGPAWATNPNAAADTEHYDIAAKVPPGTTKEQFQLMLQNLLADRFHMAAHFEKRDFEGYELTVAKGGIKMKESVIDPNGPSGRQPNGFPVPTPLTFKEGFPVLAPGNTPATTGIDVNGRMLISVRQRGMDEIAKRLVETALRLQNGPGGAGVRVVDKTGLTGKYDFHFQYALPSSNRSAQTLAPGADFLDSIGEPAPDVATAVREQLGLVLTKGKIAMDVLVIDHLEKVPTEN